MFPQSPLVSAPTPATDSLLGLADSGVRALLHSLVNNAPPLRENPPAPSPPPPSPPPISFNWNLFEATEDTTLQPSVEQTGASAIAQKLLEHMDEVDDIGSDEEPAERSDDGQNSVNDDEPRVAGEYSLIVV